MLQCFICYETIKVLLNVKLIIHRILECVLNAHYYAALIVLRNEFKKENKVVLLAELI